MRWREQILVRACTHTDTHTQSDAVLHSEFIVCHGKLGWRLSRLLGNVFAIYGVFFFFSLCCSLHQQCLLCPWHLNAIRYKFLPTSAVHSSADIFAWSCLPCETLFLPLQFACTYIKRLNIFLLTHCETYNGTENKRKIRVSRQKKERAQMKKMQRNFEHVAYTWWLFLFMHAYSLMSHNCRLVFRPTHHSHSTYTQNPRYRKVHVS